MAFIFETSFRVDFGTAEIADMKQSNFLLSVCRRLLAVLFVLSSMPFSAHAHHSHGNYDIGKKIQVEGVITELLLRNPHV